MVLRVFSFNWNYIPHGDVDTDVQVAQWLATIGEFMIDPEAETIMIGQVPYDVSELGGERSIQHPPLWALLGAGTMHFLGLPLNADGAYFAYRLLSLLSGAVALLLSFVVTRRFVDAQAAWIVTGLLAVSWLMIDYSGNGSFYMLQTVLYLLWLMIVSAKMTSDRKALALGVVCGSAYMLSYQCIFLIGASVIALFVEHRKSLLNVARGSAIVIAVTVIIALPWLIRSYFLFGDPLFGHTVNTVGYLYEKAGIQTETVATTFSGMVQVVNFSLHHWLINNLYYIARKLFMLAPVVFIFFAYALVEYMFDRKRFRKMLPILLLLTLHMAISAAWPITKFRFFVPMLPLVLILAFEHIKHLKFAAQKQQLVIGGTFAAFIILSALTWYAEPTHTYYYDGALTNDPFRDTEAEYQFMLDHGYKE